MGANSVTGYLFPAKGKRDGACGRGQKDGTFTDPIGLLGTGTFLGGGGGGVGCRPRQGRGVSISGIFHLDDSRYNEYNLCLCRKRSSWISGGKRTPRRRLSSTCCVLRTCYLVGRSPSSSKKISP